MRGAVLAEDDAGERLAEGRLGEGDVARSGSSSWPGTRTSSAKPPSRVTPTAFQARQWFCRLIMQKWHSSQVTVGSTITRSPGASPSPRRRRATTSPASSWPGTSGNVGKKSPSQMWTSVPQTPHALARTSTSRGPMAGSATSVRMVIFFTASRTAAFTVDLQIAAYARRAQPTSRRASPNPAA